MDKIRLEHIASGSDGSSKLNEIAKSNHSILLQQYKLHLQEQERSNHTIAKYLHDAKKFLLFASQVECYAAGGMQSKSSACGILFCKADVLAFKANLVAHYAPASVNSMLAAVNHFLAWAGHVDCRVKPLKIQREAFCCAEKELTEREYQRLLTAAEASGNRKVSLLLQTICATGIRVSELRYITVQAVQAGKTTVRCKGKNRVIFLPKRLCGMLRQFCNQMGIAEGSIFCTKGGKPLDRSNIWKMMKRLCAKARVNPQKVFPHNLRHLFARTYYKLEKDIARLADLLGHNSVNTTRIYMLESGKQHARQINRMNLLYENQTATPLAMAR